MSRIIVKQLPKNINEERLREIFGSKGKITDLKLKYTPDGKFRQFCFIGYSNEEEARAAIDYFDNTCIQTSRIKVELCAALGSESKPPAKSKYSKDSAELAKEKEAKEQEREEKKTKKNEKVRKVDEILAKHKDDPEFQEFMKVHDKNRTLWANDVEVLEEKDGGAKGERNEADENTDDGDGDDDDDDDDDKTPDDDEEGNEDDHDDDASKLAEKPISDLEYMKSLITTASEGKKESKNEIKKESKKESKQPKVHESIDLFTVKIRNVPYNVKRQDIQKFFKPLKPFSIRLPAKSHGFCYVGFKTEKELSKALLKHKSFIKGVQIFLTDFTEKNKKTKDMKEEENNKNNKSVNAKWAKQAANLDGEESIAESGCIFFRNLSFTVTEDDLTKVFEKFGPIAEITLPVDNLTRQIKGFGTVTFVLPEHAVQAFNKLDGTDFHGRLLHLLPGKTKHNDEDEMDENDAGLSFKQKKALKLKKTAQHTASWNTLFLGSNAVAEILSNKFNMSKEKILDTSDGGSSAAVRIALGETQIVMEMKKFLEDNDVHLNAFDVPTTKRSKTIILAKNLPAGTTSDELMPLFSKFGPIGRLVLPPSGVTALIEFHDPTEARNAFKKLAFSKFKHLPLFLEWAPENAFTKTLSGEKFVSQETETKKEDGEDKDDEKSSDNQNKKNTKDSKESTNRNPQTEEATPESKEEEEESKKKVENEEEDDEEEDEPPEENTTLFLRNLNFKTVQETVYEHFKHLGAIHTVEVAKRKDPENPRVMKSLGYGFIQFKKSAVAEKALKNMQLTTIDGNAVELKRSDRTLRTPQAPTRRKVKMTEQTGTKILVRNIPFQTKEKEVRDIFKAFGELRSVRLPKKTTPGETNHIRGFGFVDFLSKGEAKKAFQALSQSTHLYGRRLVLEWAAKDDEDVDEIRKRTAEQFEQQRQSAGAAGRRGSKRAVFNMEEALSKMPKLDKIEDDI